MNQAIPPCSVLILAGGRGQRMGGQDKGLLEWRGQPLIAHLHSLTRPLTDDLIISCNRNAERYAAYADRLVHDDDLEFPGPLAGIRAGLAVARHDYLLVLPCDAPLLESRMLERLRLCAAEHPEQPVMLRQGEQWEPLFCVIPKILLASLEQAWAAGERSPRRMLLSLDAVALRCGSANPQLANLNTPALLASSARTSGKLQGN